MSVVNPTPEASAVPTAAAAPSSAVPETAGQIAQGSQSATGFTAMTKISSMAQLRQKAPKVYNMMMQGIAMNIIQQSEKAQQKLKEMNRKAREDAGQS